MHGIRKIRGCHQIASAARRQIRAAQQIKQNVLKGIKGKYLDGES